MKVLKETSRTFYIPITLLKKELRLTVGSAYLSMRAIDEIEDHETMDENIKEQLLRKTEQLLLEENFDLEAYQTIMTPYEEILPEVTIRLGDWLAICPVGVVQEVKAATAEMAGGMADWVKKNWVIKTKDDLDNYTYYVAGLVGVKLSRIWKWYGGSGTDHEQASDYGGRRQAEHI